MSDKSLGRAPSNSSQKGKRGKKLLQKTNLYVILPARVTGDLWHLAAAQILSNKYPETYLPEGAEYYINIVPVIVLNYEASFSKEKLDADRSAPEGWNAAELKDQVQNGRMTFNFLRDLGLDCLLAVIKDAKGEVGLKKLARFMFRVSDDWYDTLYNKQITTAEALNSFSAVFEAAIGDVTTQRTYNPNAVSDSYMPPLGSRKLDYLAATTVAMQALAEQAPKKALNPDGLSERLHFLHTALNPNGSKRVPYNEDLVLSDEQVEEQANERYKTFLGLIHGEKQKVVLYNHRSNKTNRQTDSNMEIFGFFYTTVKSVDPETQIIVINTGGALGKFEDYPDVEIFDLFRKTEKPTVPFPGINPLVTCRFWSKIAKFDQVLGVFSGRSGSVDVAAFNGVNCYYWDVPYLQVAANDRELIKTFGLIPNPLDKNFTWKDWNKFVGTVEGQVPQCLRCIQLRMVMTIGLVDKGVMKDGSPGEVIWHTVQGKPLKLWLAGKRGDRGQGPHDFPVCPANLDKRGVEWLIWERDSPKDKLGKYIPEPDKGQAQVLEKTRDQQITVRSSLTLLLEHFLMTCTAKDHSIFPARNAGKLQIWNLVCRLERYWCSFKRKAKRIRGRILPV